MATSFCVLIWWGSGGERDKGQALLCCCSVIKLCLTLCDPVDCSSPGFPVLHHLLEFAQTHVHWVGDAVQPSHPLSSLPPPALNLSQHQGLLQWVGSSHQVAKVLERLLQPFIKTEAIYYFFIKCTLFLMALGLPCCAPASSSYVCRAYL